MGNAPAIISLASSCVMYERQNQRFPQDQGGIASVSLPIGVCYNNIANLHLKNGRYQLAYESFEKAVAEGKKCLFQYTKEIGKATFSSPMLDKSD
jgi:hypothetical protein